MHLLPLSTTFSKDPLAIEYYTLLLKPFAYIPLIGFPWLLIGIPSLAINIIRKTTSITFHYDSAAIIPSLAIGAIYGFYYIHLLLQKLPIKKILKDSVFIILSTLFLLASLRVNYHYSPLPTTPSCSCYIYAVSDEDREFERKLQAIPKDASVTASLEIRPHVSHRELAFTLPSATESASYIAIITQNRIIESFWRKTL